MQNNNYHDNVNPDSNQNPSDIDGNADDKNLVEATTINSDSSLDFLNAMPLCDLSPDQLRIVEESAKKERKNKAEKKLIEHWQLFVKSVDDTDMTLTEALELCNPSILKGGKKISKIKFRNPDNKNDNWTGRGRKPGWYNDCLERGITEQEMLV